MKRFNSAWICGRCYKIERDYFKEEKLRTGTTEFYDNLKRGDTYRQLPTTCDVRGMIEAGRPDAVSPASFQNIKADSCADENQQPTKASKP